MSTISTIEFSAISEVIIENIPENEHQILLSSLEKIVEKMD